MFDEEWMGWLWLGWNATFFYYIHSYNWKKLVGQESLVRNLLFAALFYYVWKHLATEEGFLYRIGLGLYGMQLVKVFIWMITPILRPDKSLQIDDEED